MSRVYNPATNSFMPDEPIERHNLSLVTHDIQGNMPNKFRKEQHEYHRDVDSMYPPKNLKQGSNLQDSKLMENRSMPPYLFVDERSGNAKNPGQYFKNSAS